MDSLQARAVRRVTSAVGAVIDGVDMAQTPHADTVQFVRQMLVDHGVVFLRYQTASKEQLWSFLSHFGTVHKEDSFGTDDDTADDVQDSDFQPTKTGTAVWHTDSSFLETPPTFTLLRMVRPPPYGGDTCWASMVAAYEALSEPMRTMLDKLTAVHSIHLPMTRLDTDFGGQFLESYSALHAQQQIHPVVLVHPESGRKALYVTEFCTTRIVELSPAESRHVLDILFDHIKSPNFNMRWRWTTNDVAIWDNRNVQHYAVPDYTAEKVVHRFIVAGEKPRGPEDLLPRPP